MPPARAQAGGVADLDDEDEEAEATTVAGTVVRDVLLRASPDPAAEPVDRLRGGTVVHLRARSGIWVQAQRHAAAPIGWVPVPDLRLGSDTAFVGLREVEPPATDAPGEEPPAPVPPVEIAAAPAAGPTPPRAPPPRQAPRPPVEAAPAGGPLAATTTGWVNLRVAPSANSARVLLVAPNRPVQIRGRNPAATWVRVRTEGADGWMTVQALAVDGGGRRLAGVPVSAGGP